jgi:DNA-binding MurR/RpiR family transcriptional regulator
VAAFRAHADRAVLDRAVDLLARAETIYLIGLRRSFPITSYMSYAMGKLGVRNILVDAVAGMAAEQAGFISSKDAALSISFTPYASETVALTASARARGAKIVAVTDSVFSPIAAPADVMIEIGEANFEGFRSMATTMAVAMTLCVAVAARRGES